MLSIIRAEHGKTAKSMNRILVWAFPVMTLVLAFLLTAGMPDAYAESVWNWWYTLLLPGMLAILCYLSMGKERKTKYYHLMTLPTEKKKLILGKIIYMGCLILAANILIFVGAVLGGMLLTTSVPFGGAAAAIVMLTIVQLWEIPVFLFLSERFGMVVELLICLFMTVGGTIFSQTGKWYLLVSAIPMRVMTPLLHILPNGLKAEAGNPFLNENVILPGVCLSLIWFVILTVLFLNWFENREVK